MCKNEERWAGGGKVDEIGGRPLGVGVISALEKSGSSIGAETDSSYKDLGVSLKPMNSRTRIHTNSDGFRSSSRPSQNIDRAS
ncbi:unnamed protein product [Musa textilis]